MNPLIQKHLNSFLLITSLIVLSTINFACSSEEATIQLSAEERFKLGMDAYKDEEYLDAIEEFKVVSLQYQGSKVADSAQFYMAECRFLREEFVLAAFEYDVLLRNMSTSDFVPRARFARATCFYMMSPNSFLDQNYSHKAIDEYQAFLEYHPADSSATLAETRIKELNTKLAQKEFDSGVIYMHMEYYKAATYYFDVVLEKYHDTKYAEPSLLKKANALVNRKKYADAKEAIEKFVLKYPDSNLKSDADQLRAEIRSKMIDEEAAKNKALEKAKEKNQQPLQSGG